MSQLLTIVVGLLMAVLAESSARITSAAISSFGTAAHIESSWRPEELFPESYNKLKAPKDAEGHPVEVKIGLNITAIFGVNEADLSYRMRCTVSQTWTDNRIKYPPTEPNKRIFLDPSAVDNLWLPQTFISNSVEDTEVNAATLVMYEITSNNEVSLAARMTAKLSCDFDLSYFPHDTQTCHVILESRKNPNCCDY
jgi:hypothetical protein